MNIKELAEQAGANFEHIQWVERDLAPLFERFAELVAAHEREECVQNVLQQYEGFGTEHQGVEYVKQRIVEAIRARSKA
jgi:F0F1-type ATP synthase delta subunit